MPVLAIRSARAEIGQLHSRPQNGTHLERVRNRTALARPAEATLAALRVKQHFQRFSQVSTSVGPLQPLVVYANWPPREPPEQLHPAGLTHRRAQLRPTTCCCRRHCLIAPARLGEQLITGGPHEGRRWSSASASNYAARWPPIGVFRPQLFVARRDKTAQLALPAIWPTHSNEPPTSQL